MKLTVGIPTGRLVGITVGLSRSPEMVSPDFKGPNARCDRFRIQKRRDFAGQVGFGQIRRRRTEGVGTCAK